MGIPLEQKRIVVTGGSGFLGSFVVDALRKRGCRAIIVPRSREYNLTELGAVERLYRDARPDLVFHLAAVVGGIGANQARPATFFYENLLMGLQMIEVGRQVGVEKMVVVGTACCYPRIVPVPFRETDLWNGFPEWVTAPYGLAKKMLLVQSMAYREQHGFNSIFLIPTNLYGPRDHFESQGSHVVPALVHKFCEAVRDGRSQVVVWGTGEATREFLYVEDAAQGLLLAAERYDKSEPINMGTGIETSIDELAHMIADLVGFRGQIIWDVSRPDGQPRRCLDVSNAEEEFGFRAMTSLKQGLRKTLTWYRAYVLGQQEDFEA